MQKRKWKMESQTVLSFMQVRGGLNDSCYVMDLLFVEEQRKRLYSLC